MKQILMCNSWAFCMYQTLWKNLADNQINEKFKTKLDVILSCNGTVLQ